MKFTNNHQFKIAIISKIIISILGILSGVFINRFLGPSLKGEYTFLLNIINIFALFLNLGIYQSYPYFQRNSHDDLYNRYINLCFFQFLAYLLIFLFVMSIINNFYIQFILIILPQFILNRQFSFVLLVKKPNLKNFILIFNQFTFTLSVFLIYLFANRSSHYMFLIIFLREIILITIFFIIFRNKIKPFKINFKQLWKSIKFGIFPMLTSVLIFLNSGIDIFILKIYVNFYEIGIYSVGVGLAAMGLLLTEAFQDILYSKTSKNDSILEIKFSIKINLYISTTIFILSLIFGQFIIEFLYGFEYRGAYWITVIFFIGNIPIIFFKLIMILFLAQGKTRLVFIIILISLCICLFLLFIFIPLYGIIGSAIAISISNLVAGLSFLIFFLKFEEVKVKDLLMIKKEDIRFLLREK